MHFFQIFPFGGVYNFKVWPYDLESPTCLLSLPFYFLLIWVSFLYHLIVFLTSESWSIFCCFSCYWFPASSHCGQNTGWCSSFHIFIETYFMPSNVLYWEAPWAAKMRILLDLGDCSIHVRSIWSVVSLNPMFILFLWGSVQLICVIMTGRYWSYYLGINLWFNLYQSLSFFFLLFSYYLYCLHFLPFCSADPFLDFASRLSLFSQALSMHWCRRW